jgi:hypothetical protein
MCRPIRALTEARGHAMSKHMYAYLFKFHKIINEDDTLSSDLQVSVAQVANTHAKSPVF